MLLYLSQFFVLNSNQYINENIDKIRPQLKAISKNLNGEDAIKDFNTVLWKMVSKK
jgi:5-bromo-4-chloroindolyl phosphate hydrolysis protein